MGALGEPPRNLIRGMGAVIVFLGISFVSFSFLRLVSVVMMLASACEIWDLVMGFCAVWPARSEAVKVLAGYYFGEDGTFPTQHGRRRRYYFGDGGTFPT